MLKLLKSSSCLHSRSNGIAPTSIQPISGNSIAPLVRVPNSPTGFSPRNPNLGRQPFFSSDASAVVSTNPKPENFLTDPKLLAALQESRKWQAPYAASKSGFRCSLPPSCFGSERHQFWHLSMRFMVVGFVHSDSEKKFYRFYSTLNSNKVSIPIVSKLIANQHWWELKRYLEDFNPTELLHQLLDSEADPELIFRYFNWSQKEFNVPHTLELSCRLMHLLANSKKYPKIRAFLDGFVKRNDKHSVSSIFHALLMCNNQFCANSIIIDMLVLAYVKNSKTNLAYEAFGRAGDYGFKLSVLSCNPLLCALVKEKEIGHVEYMYKEIIKRRIQADLFTFNIVINGLCKVGKLNKAGDVIQDTKAWGISPNVVTYNTLIDGYCKMGKLGKMYKADAILKEMVANKISPNEITYNILIDGFCKDENAKAALKVFQEMRKQGLKPNVVTYNSLITGLCAEGKLEEACGLRDEMLGSNLKPNVVTCNTLINGFCKKQMIREAKELFDHVRHQGVQPDVITYNTLMDAYCKNGMMEEAFALCSSMPESGVLPNVSTYNCLITGLCKQGNMEKARKLFDEMQEIGLKADLVTFNVLIDATCKVGETRKATRILKEMLKTGLSPNHLTYNMLMEGYCREGNLKAALNVKEQMEKDGKRANIVTYNVLIKGYCKKGKLADANGLLNEMLEKGLIPNQTTYEVVRDEMMEKGFIPDIEGHLRNVSGSL